MKSLVNFNLTEFWDALPHLKIGGRDTVIRWMAKKAGKVRGDFVTTEAELQIAMAVHWEWDFYVAPNPVTKLLGIRHSAEDVSHWSWLLLDIDPLEKTVDAHRAMNAYIHRANQLLNKTTTPLILHSGRGFQAWFRLADYVLDDTLEDGKVVADIMDISDKRMGIQPFRVNRRTATAAMKNFLQEVKTDEPLYGCQVDTTCSDLPRVMRCPGSRNQKTQKWVTLVTPGETDYELGHVLVERTPLSRYETPDLVERVGEGKYWSLVVSYLSPTAREFLTSGWQEPGRHNAMYHTAKSLREIGVSKEETHKALTHGNSMCRNGLGQIKPLEAHEVIYILDRVYRK